MGWEGRKGGGKKEGRGMRSGVWRGVGETKGHIVHVLYCCEGMGADVCVCVGVWVWVWVWVWVQAGTLGTCLQGESRKGGLLWRLPRDRALVSTGGRVDLRREPEKLVGPARMAGPMLSLDERPASPVDARRRDTCRPSFAWGCWATRSREGGCTCWLWAGVAIKGG